MTKPNVLEEVELYDLLSRITGEEVGKACASILDKVSKGLLEGIGTGGDDPVGILNDARSVFNLSERQVSLLKQVSKADAKAAWNKLTQSVDIGINFISDIVRDTESGGWTGKQGDHVSFLNNSGQFSSLDSWEIDVDFGVIHVGWKS
jgi:hypothetical protein